MQTASTAATAAEFGVASPATGRSPGGSPPPVQRGAHSPCAGPHLPGARSPGDSPSPAILQPSRRSSGHVPAIRPPFSGFPPNPPSPRLRRLPAPGLAGSDFSPVRFIAGGKTRKEGSDGYIHAPTATPPLRGRGNGRRSRRENRRSPLRTNSRADRCHRALGRDGHCRRAGAAPVGAGRPWPNPYGFPAPTRA
jgi:hypothetical protein